MPRFAPFRALRYDPTAAGASIDDLIAPPYDVLSPTQVDALEARHRYNIVHIDVPRERDGAGRYDLAARRLGEWIDQGVLVLDAQPSFTVYRMRFQDSTGIARDIAGVLGGLEVVDDGAGGVLPHERITPKASTDRLDLTRACRANLSPVWGLSLADGLTRALAEPGELLASVDVDGVEHRVERIDDPQRIAEITAVIGSDDVLIADGHHRYGISRTYRDESRQISGSLDTAAEYALTFVNELVADQLSVEAIHRLYSGTTFDALRDHLATRFDLVDAPPPDDSTLRTMAEQGCLYLLGPDGAGFWMTARPGAFDGMRSLDGLWLEHTLGDLDVEVNYQHGLAEVSAAVATGDAVAAVLIRPVSVAEIERTAREGLLMPPKSTFFTPKLRTGFVIRMLDR